VHQIRFQQGLCPRPRWGSLQRSPKPPSWFKGALLLRGGERRIREGKGDGRGGSGKGRRGEWKGREEGRKV